VEPRNRQTSGTSVPLVTNMPFPFFGSNLGQAGAIYPQLYDVGGNTGTPDSFTSLDIVSLTCGVYNLETLSENNNAACLGYQFTQQAAPDLVKGLFTTLLQ